MRSKIKEETRFVLETFTPKKEKLKSRRKKKTSVENEILPLNNDLPKKRQQKDKTAKRNHPLKVKTSSARLHKKRASSQKSRHLKELTNVKCLECHCIGKVMKTIDGIVLFPNKVKKTLLELGGGIIMPNINKVVPTVKIANNTMKKFSKGFNSVSDNENNKEYNGYFGRITEQVGEFRKKIARGFENAKGQKQMKLLKMIEREKTKTPAKDVPERFTGLFSDEFETDNFWKSKKRFSLQ